MGFVERFVGGTEVGSGTESYRCISICCSSRDGLGTKSALMRDNSRMERNRDDIRLGYFP